MRKHRTVQIIGIGIIAAALVYLVLGLIGAISLSSTGLGAGWSTGWRGWLTIPVLAATVLGLAMAQAPCNRLKSMRGDRPARPSRPSAARWRIARPGPRCLAMAWRTSGSARTPARSGC